MNMRLSEIKIPTDFESSTPNTYKYNKCERYYKENYKQDRYLIVNENNYLIDGYIMYLVLKNNGAEYGDARIVTLNGRKYTDRQRKHYGKLIPTDKNDTYKRKPTTYVYGIHYKGFNHKTYMWRIPPTWTVMIKELQPGDKVYCKTRFGKVPVIVTQIETKDKIDTDMIVRKVCSHKIIRNGEILKYDKGKNAYV